MLHALFLSRFLFPRSDTADVEEDRHGERVQRGEADGKYELHARVNAAITEELKELILNGEWGDGVAKWSKASVR